MSLLGLFLAVSLALGIIYLLFAYHKSAERPNLRIARHRTENIQAALVFVQEIKGSRVLEDLLAYQIVNQMVKIADHNPRYVWLLHTEFGGDEGGSSNANASAIVTKFQNNDHVKIDTRAITNIHDTEEVFRLVQSILFDSKLPVKVGDMICDCTAGPKPLTLGIALAAIGKARLVYFPGTPLDSEYDEIDASSFIRSRSS